MINKLCRNLIGQLQNRFRLSVVASAVVISVAGGAIFFSLSNSVAFANPDYCEACEDDPPPPECPCGDCVNGCGGQCTDNDNDGICDGYDNCVGYESTEWEEVCNRECEDENPYTGECEDWGEYGCDIVGWHETCIPY